MIHLTNYIRQSKADSRDQMRICLVCSSGGHLIKTIQLKPWWENYEHFWVTDKNVSNLALLDDEKVYFGFFPVQRHFLNFIANFCFAIFLIITNRPTHVFSTGAGIAPPFFLVGKLLGCKTIFIETFSIIPKTTLSGKLCYPISDHFIVQHPDLMKVYPKAKYVGSIL